MLFACDNPAILLMFSVARAGHKFDFRLVINETPNKWRPVKGHKIAPTHVLTECIGFRPTVVARVNGLYPHCADQMHSPV